MKRFIQFGLFIVVFLAIYSGLNYFVLNGIFNLLMINKGIIFYIALAVATLSYIICMLLEKYYANGLTRALYFISATWIGVLLISFSLLILLKIFDLFYFIPRPYAAKVVISLTFLLSIYALVKGNLIRINKIKININGLKKNFKAVQLSDIHLGTINQNKFLEKVVKKTNSLKPEIVFITGDLVDGSAPLKEHMIDPINKIKAPVFYVIGNHEIYEGIDKIMPILSKTKMKILRNKITRWRDISIIGIDYSDERGQLKKALSNINFKRNKNILLYHSPSLNADYLSKIGISVHLAGHTHHGQIFPFNLLTALAYPYFRGLNLSEDGKTSVYVSPGTGTWGPPMRLGSNCEITFIDFEKKED